jgi:fatty acid-binding protein DegV
MMAECGPAIGAHVGPGAVGVAVLPGPRSGGAPPSD